MAESIEIGSVTGVDVQLDIAGPGARAYAFVIDWHIRLIFAAAWFLIGNFIYTGAFYALSTDAPDFQSYSLVVIVPSVAIYFLYHYVLEIAMRGTTPGKRIAGVRIVTNQGEEPGTLALLIRNLMRIFDSLPTAYMIGLVTTIFTRNAVRVGDIAAGTVLIYDGKHRQGAVRPISTEAVTRHGLNRAELTTELLERWDELAPERRFELGRKMLIKLNSDLQDADFSDDHQVRMALEQSLEG